VERTVGHFPPEILVLFKVLVSSRSVTDDAETDERDLIEVAYLGNGSRFHIYSQSFREVMLDDTFTYDKQSQYVPVAKEIKAEKNKITYTFPAHSFTQIKVRMKK
jgi:hypothetical protein